jgi:hypothetical protein
MVNDVQWIVGPPDTYQLEVQNPAYVFTVRVTYEYVLQGNGGGVITGVPAFPNIYIGIIAAMGAGVLAYLFRRRVLGRRTAGM